MSECTPTTEPSMEDIRADWVLAVTRHHDSYTTGRTMASMQELYGGLFDRVIAAHDAEVRAQALTITDEMVERAAVALWSQAAKGTLQPNYPWDGITAELREQFRVHARAALEAAFRENGSSDS